MTALNSAGARKRSASRSRARANAARASPGRPAGLVGVDAGLGRRDPGRRVGAVGERRDGRALVVLVRGQRRDVDRDAGVLVRRQEPRQVLLELAPPGPVDLAPVGDVLLPDHPRHQRVRRGAPRRPRPAPERRHPADDVADQLDRPEPAEHEVGPDQPGRPAQRLRRRGPERAVELVVAGVDHDHVRVLGDHLVHQVQEGERVDGRHGRVDHLDVAVGVGQPQPRAQDLGERRAAVERVPDRRLGYPVPSRGV